jgi:hypothetical protein
MEVLGVQVLFSWVRSTQETRLIKLIRIIFFEKK